MSESKLALVKFFVEREHARTAQVERPKILDSEPPVSAELRRKFDFDRGAAEEAYLGALLEKNPCLLSVTEREYL